MRIDSFQGKWRFLSNFWEAPTLFEGILYPTAEHAYQAAKTMNIGDRYGIKSCRTPGRAKRMGKKLVLRPDWEEVKLVVMEAVVKSKFTLNNELRLLLKQTGSMELVEGNGWHDNFWGDCWCDDCADIPGQNHLGHIQMKVREGL